MQLKLVFPDADHVPAAHVTLHVVPVAPAVAPNAVPAPQVSAPPVVEEHVA